MMKKLFVLASLGLMGNMALVACNRDDTPAEKAADRVEDATDHAGDKLEDTGDNVKDKVDDATE